MSQRQQISLLPDGRRLHLQDGPIDLVIGADGTADAVARAYDAAKNRFATLLDELCAELTTLRRAVTHESPPPDGAVARRMHAAALPYASRHFVTPMVAVAGAVAEAILQAMVTAALLTRAYVNNGGDIALHLTEGSSFDIGMVARPDEPHLFGKLNLRSRDPVRGIATSGRHGRSFSLGIADAVTVLAEDAPTADAAATMIANAIDLPGHPAILRTPANALQPDSDLGSLLVTRSVGPLTATDIARALTRGQRYAEQLLETGRIQAAGLHLAGTTRIVQASSGPMTHARPVTQANPAKEIETHAAS